MKVYVDGSFSDKNPNVVGWAFVMCEDGKEPIVRFGELAGDVCKMRQIGGEMASVIEAIQFAEAQGLTIDAIYYDYSGLKAWATGEWKARNGYTAAYKEFINKHCANAKMNPETLFIKISPNENKADRYAQAVTGGQNRHTIKKYPWGEK